MDFAFLYDALIAKLKLWAEGLTTMLPNAMVATAVVIAFWLLSKLAYKVSQKTLERIQTNKAARSLMSTAVRVSVFGAGIVIALGVLNLDKALTSILAGAGVVGLALGFAFQDLAANLISGIGLAMNQELPFKIGDVVETNNTFGTVKSIGLRTSLIHTPDGKTVVIPNKNVYQDKVVNYSAAGRIRIDLSCGVSYGDDLQKVQSVALEAMEQLSSRDTSLPVEFYFQGFGDSSINLLACFWVRYEKHADYLNAMSEAVKRLKGAFDEHDIVIPFPIRTLDFGIRGGEPLASVLAHRADRSPGA
ncbi:MAG: mechanosensitive ion channel family protein [Myxococcota bacterium]